VRRVAPERICTLVLGFAVALSGRWLPPMLVVGLMAVGLAVMQAITMHRLRGRFNRT
jgi:hypothetical protein